MNTPAATLTAWRAELVVEAEQLEAELATVREAKAEAEAAYNQAADEWRTLLAAACRPFTAFEEMAAELHGRLAEARHDLLRPASSRRGSAMGRLKALEGTLAGRRLAIRQIDRALSGESGKVSPLIREKVPKREPARIDYETIRMPGER